MSMLELIWRGAQVHGQLVLDKIPAALWVVLVRYVRNAVSACGALTHTALQRAAMVRPEYARTPSGLGLGSACQLLRRAHQQRTVLPAVRRHGRGGHPVP